MVRTARGGPAAHEEASVAGESPDKTEQRKSSGTAAEERDPRFAVFRDPDADANADAADKGADSGADADSGTGAGSGADARPTSDTATAVFRPRLPEDAARREPAPEAEPEPESAAVTASEAPEEAVTPPEGTGAAEGRTGPDAGVETSDPETPGPETSAEASAKGAADEPHGRCRCRG